MAKFGVKEVMDVTFYDTVTGKPVANFDTLKLTSLENKSDDASARGGKGNSKLLTWDFNRESSMKIQDALLSPKSLEMLTGNAVTTGVATVYMRQDTEWSNVSGTMSNKGDLYPLKANASGVILLAFTPKEAVANILVYDASDDGGTPISMSGATLTGTSLTVSGASNKQVVVYYTYDTGSTAQTYLITSDKFPSTYRIVGDTVVRNASTGKDEAFQVIINKAKLKSNFNLEFKADGDPGVFDMDVEILREDSSPTMVKMIKY